MDPALSFTVSRCAPKYFRTANVRSVTLVFGGKQILGLSLDTFSPAITPSIVPRIRATHRLMSPGGGA
jgi:hypothetical protein